MVYVLVAEVFGGVFAAGYVVLVAVALRRWWRRVNACAICNRAATVSPTRPPRIARRGTHGRNQTTVEDVIPRAAVTGKIRFRAYANGSVVIEHWYDGDNPAELAEHLAGFNHAAAEAVDAEGWPWAVEFFDPAAPSGTSAHMRFDSADGQDGDTFAATIAALAVGGVL